MGRLERLRKLARLPRLKRFSLRSLLLCVLLIGSAACLWLNWGPWEPVFRFETEEEDVLQPNSFPWYSHSCNRFSAITSSGALLIWDAETGNKIGSIEVGDCWIGEEIGDLGQVILENKSLPDLTVVDIANARLEAKITSSDGVKWKGAMWSPDRKWFVAWTEGRQLGVWKTKSWEHLYDLTKGQGGFFPIKFSSDSSRVLTNIGAGWTVIDIQTGQLLIVLPDTPTLSPDMKYYLDRDQPSGPVIRWIGSESQPVPVRVPKDTKVDSWRWTSPDALMAECADKSVLLFAAKDGSLNSKIDTVESVFWNDSGKPDGAPFVARRTQDGIWVLALPSGKELFRMSEGGESVVSVDRVYGSDKFFTMDDQDVIRIWDIGQQKMVAKLSTRAAGRPTSVADFSGVWMTTHQEESWTQTETVLWDKKSCGALASNQYALGSPRPIPIAMEEGLFAVDNREGKGWELFRLSRPAFWYGFLWLPEFYLTLVLALGLGWSLWRDRKL